MMEKHESFNKENLINIREILAVIGKRKLSIAAFVIGVFILVTGVTFLMKPTYTAQVRLLIEKAPNILTFEEIFQLDTIRDDFYRTQIKLLEHRAAAGDVIEKLNLFENEEFTQVFKKDKKPLDKEDPAVRTRLIDSFLKKLRVDPIKMTRLVVVSFKAQNPNLAADILNAYIESYIRIRIEDKYATTAQASEFLTTQITDLRTVIEQKEREMQVYGAEKNIISLNDEETTIINKLGELNRALTDAQVERLKKEAYYNEIKNVSLDHIPTALDNLLIQNLRAEYVKLRREITKKQEIFQPDYPEMQRLNTELEESKKLLQKETQNLISATYSDYQAAFKRERSLERVFSEQKQEAFQLNNNAITYNSLKIDIENKKNLLTILMKRQSETGISSQLQGLRTSNIKVVEEAEVPLRPSNPKKMRNMLLALIFGLLGGVGLALVFEYLDNSVKDHEDVKKYSGLPCLGVIPHYNSNGVKNHRLISRPRNTSGKKETDWRKKKDKKDSASLELVTYFSPESNIAECYRSLKTSFIFSSTESNSKSIALTSALPKEGKTTTSSNLAVVLAQANKKVLLLDADLRKPEQHKIFQRKDQAGLSTYLTSGLEISELIKQTPIPNLFLINAGPIPTNPAELLESEKMSDLMKCLRQTFEYILIDTPPMLAVSDALVLGPNIDGMLMIVRGEKTSKDAMKLAKEKLDQAHITTLGVIINNMKYSRHSYNNKEYYY